MAIVLIVTTSLIHFLQKARENVLFELKSEWVKSREQITYCGQFCAGTLAAGTNKGKVAMWKHVARRKQDKQREGQERWELQAPSVLEGEAQLTQLHWGGGRSLLAVNCGQTVVILNEQVMNAHYNQQVRTAHLSWPLTVPV